MPEELTHSLDAMLGELSAVFRRVDTAGVDGLVERILAAPRVFTAAAGRSGMILRCAAMRLMHMGKTVYVVGEIVTPSIAGDDLLLMVSGSGETGSLVGMVQKAKRLGAKTAVVTANAGSTLARSADAVVVIPAPTPKAEVRDFVASSQPMGSLFEQSAFLLLDAMIREIMRKTAQTSEEMFLRHANLE